MLKARPGLVLAKSHSVNISDRDEVYQSSAVLFLLPFLFLLSSQLLLVQSMDCWKKCAGAFFKKGENERGNYLLVIRYD